VRRAGERLRVTAQLIRAHDGFHLWSETYDSESTDAIAVQEDIAEKIAGAMDVVLDAEKRAAMRRAGLRDVEAFILYQKGVDLYGQAHGGLEPIGALRQANAYFEQVMQRVPEFGQVYVDHSDLYIHLLNEESWGRVETGVTEEDLASAYEIMIRDFELGVKYAATPAERAIAEVDLAFVSGNWRGLSGRIDLALKGAGTSCNHGNWLPNVAITVGYTERFRTFINRVVTCNPRWSNAWFNASRAALIAGDKAEALRIAREATEKAPGGWVQMSLVRALIANEEIEEARDIIETQVTSGEFALIYRTLIAATEGNRQLAEQLAEQRQAEFGPTIFTIILHAWSGNREAANRQAASMADTRFGNVALFLLPSWCQCGAPWDLEATPEFAAKIKQANIPWPPPAPVEFPLKSW
jgi:tetratricopeptide (TPR) repeat protein